MENKEKIKWYFKTSTLMIAILCIGPFALPLFWFNPRFNKRSKIIISLILIVAFYLVAITFINSLKLLANTINKQINGISF